MKVPKVRDKLPNETRVYGFSFAKQKEITEGLQTLSSAIFTQENDQGGAPLTIGSVVVENIAFTARASISGGTPGVMYQIRCDATTSGSAILGMYGNLNVVDPEDLEEVLAE